MDKMTREEQAVKDDADLVVALQTQKEELTPEDKKMLHALIVVKQIKIDLAKKVVENNLDPLEIAHLKDALVEAELELTDARKVFDIAKKKRAEIAAVK